MKEGWDRGRAGLVPLVRDGATRLVGLQSRTRAWSWRDSERIRSPRHSSKKSTDGQAIVKSDNTSMVQKGKFSAAADICAAGQSRAKHEYCAKKRTSQRRLNSEDFPTFGRPTIPIFRLFLTLPNLAAAVWLQWQNFSNEKHTDCNDMDDCKSATSTRNQVPKVEQQC